VKAAAFKYTRARTPEEAVLALAQFGDEARILAGGQSLVPMMNLRLARPEVLVDIGGCALSGIDELAGQLRIGATTTQNAARASVAVRQAAPLLERALGHVGHHALRNRGTIGGSIAHADPAAEIPAVLLALDGEIVVTGERGTRTIGADDVFVSPYTTSLTETELLTSVRFPGDPPAAWGFAELARRRGDFAIAGAAASFDLASDGTIADSRIALFGVDERPIRAIDAERILAGSRLDDADAVTAAAAAARELADPIGDLHGSKAYRKRMVAVVVRRALQNAAAEQRGAT
jgi:carbon-monoxide dehydrogenase medium subunit